MLLKTGKLVKTYVSTCLEMLFYTFPDFRAAFAPCEEMGKLEVAWLSKTQVAAETFELVLGSSSMSSDFFLF